MSGKYFTATFEADEWFIDFLNGMQEKLKDLTPLMKTARVFLKQTVNENFNTSGTHTGEKWKEWSDAWKKRRMQLGKSGNRILSMDGNLQKHISAKSGADFAKVYNHEKYAAIHNFGFDGKNKKGVKMNMPQRQFMRLDKYRVEDLYVELYLKLKDILFEQEVHRKVYGE